ncbi:Asp-tRNA(Asn)/Glu-tRNA(Gln) amidotransferase subunit GatB [Faecalibaculum rodentium]|uniref:Aspartyl/glutamyl-tRNA(Asn/Gln) amidotransferase subunit B n=2 Tax=Faecalibaculum rodentium TaxID=1702221 RepID=A0A140DWD4_9FIRM|nr:Asp-tRNA(Asn)/Glu-tRNA(Gln) amidotransferase subunit GatB [Faecalibaculum rodentium]AMK54961.1 aspartyl/glutamyl-tRNA(Asn/Gln) amidotransferase, B subunit [Faecalibaculum rodentium]
MSKYKTTIGIEIHCELKTGTKMFSGAPVKFGETANTCTSVVDLAMPGTLPSVNKEAVRLAIKACTGLHCDIDPLVKFDRKNYYYSDLPKGFQITQQFHPIGRDGYVEIETEEGSKRIRIERIHMEEDTAKQFHRETGTYIDFNRAGVPLVEIVSRPDMHSAEEAAAYVDTLRQILLYLNVSDVKMEEGSMRCDVNISLSADDSLGTKTEIKNLNSIANVQKAVAAEIERQSRILDEGGRVEQATRRYDESQKTTVLMRKKEGAVDYKYFPEPNIFPIQLDEAWIRDIQDTMEELPAARRARFMKDYGLGEYDAQVLVADPAMADYYEEAAKTAKDAKKTANWVIGDLSAALNRDNRTFANAGVAPEHLAQLVNLVADGTISGKQAKTVFEDMLSSGKEPAKIVEEKGMKQVTDEGAILALVTEVLDANPKSIEDYKAGKDRAIGFLVGQVMKKSRGTANPKRTNELIREELAKR